MVKVWLISFLLMFSVNVTGTVIFSDGFDDPIKDVIESPPGLKIKARFSSFYHTCVPWNDECRDIPGDAAQLWIPGQSADIFEFIKRLEDQDKFAILSTESGEWQKVANHPRVVAISAMDEPDYREIRFHPRHIWDEFITELLVIKQMTDKPIFCNFSAIAHNSLRNLPRHLPNHPDYVTAYGNSRAKQREIPQECDWVGYTPSYGTPIIGPLNELRELNKPILMVLDGYGARNTSNEKAWDFFHPQCSNMINCEYMRMKKLQRTMAAIKDDNIVGFKTFLWGELINEGGVGVEHQTRYLRPEFAKQGLIYENAFELQMENLRNQLSGRISTKQMLIEPQAADWIINGELPPLISEEVFKDVK